MNNPTVAPMPEFEKMSFKKALEVLVRQLRQSNDEHEASQLRSAALGAETDELLKEIGDNLAKVDEYLRLPTTDFCN